VLNLPVVYAVTLPDNRRSIQVMERLGMEPLGLTTQYYGGRELLLYQIKAE
jgi:RimJ/RimL family protein N-acetyltransferase